MIDKDKLAQLICPDAIDTSTAIFLSRLFTHDAILARLEDRFGPEKVHQVSLVARAVCVNAINLSMPHITMLSDAGAPYLRETASTKLPWNVNDANTLSDDEEEFILTPDETNPENVRSYSEDELEVVQSALERAAVDPSHTYGLNYLLNYNSWRIPRA